MTKQDKNVLKRLINGCKYNEVVKKCAGLTDANALYFTALAFDQIAAVQKNKKQPHRLSLRKSQEYIRRGLKKYPEETRFMFLSALNDLHSDHPVKALRGFRSVYNKTHEPGDLISVANALKTCDRYNEALKIYRKAMRAGTLSRIMIWHNIASTYKQMKKMDVAKRAARRGLREKPKNNFERMIAEHLRQLTKD